MFNLPTLAQDAPMTPDEAAEQMRRAMEQFSEQFADAAGESVAVGVGAMIAGLIVGLIVFTVIAVVLALLVYLPYSKVPAEHQKIKPPLVFLMIVPLFGIVWNFIATARVSESFKSYFDAAGDTAIGDAGKNLGLWFSICLATSFALGITVVLSCLSPIASIAALILFILYVVKLFDMSGKIGQAAPPAESTAPPPAM